MKSLFGLALVFYSASTALALQSYCQPGYKPIAGKDLKLDLGALNKEFVVYQNTSSEPGYISVATQVNICDPLPIPEEPKGIFCEKGALICRRTIAAREIEDRIQELVAIVQNIAVDADDRLKPEFRPIDENADPTKSGFQYILTLNGGRYKEKAQSASITLECDESQSRSERAKDPIVVNYNENNHVLTLQWKTVFACATKLDEKVPDHRDDDKKEGDKEPMKGMSGIGIFFTIVLVLAAVYFIGGAFYNYKVYNARGRDLIPHVDFWADLPYLIRDLFAHVVDSVMSRRPGSGGYVAV